MYSKYHLVGSPAFEMDVIRRIIHSLGVHLVAMHLLSNKGSEANNETVENLIRLGTMVSIPIAIVVREILEC